MEPAIFFQDVYKEYPFYQHIITAGFKSFLFNLPKNIASLKKTRFMALNGVSFDIKKGETFGIIGKNGSGKSTILGIMAGVIREDRGRVKTCGKISSLLELGAGFHPDLSGVENIILNGILMGNTREEVVEKIDSIVEFSELGDFIYQPLRTYSSGMHVRLGFSVAVHIDPEILLIDEALAVGDLNFQEKCQKKMKAFRESGATIVIVSHDMSSIAKLCDRALWIDGGSVRATGEPKEVIMKYLSTTGRQKIFPGERPPDEESGEEPVRSDDAVPIAVSAVFADGCEEGEAERGKAFPRVAAQQVAETVREDERYVSTPHTGSRHLIPQGPLSWWDSPAIIMMCADRVADDPDVSFYDFLVRHYMLSSFDKGLSLCCRLPGIETDLMITNICKSFDVIDDVKTVERMMAGTSKERSACYDFVVCVDFLHRLKSPRIFLKRIAPLLKGEAMFIAIEYTGSTGFGWSEREIEVADMVHVLLGKKTGRLTASAKSTTDASPSVVSQNALGSAEVLPAVGDFFDILDNRYFAGPLFELVINPLLRSVIPAGTTESPEMKKIIWSVAGMDQILAKEGIFRNNYQMIVAKKRTQNQDETRSRRP